MSKNRAGALIAAFAVPLAFILLPVFTGWRPGLWYPVCLAGLLVLLHAVQVIHGIRRKRTHKTTPAEVQALLFGIFMVFIGAVILLAWLMDQRIVRLP